MTIKTMSSHGMQYHLEQATGIGGLEASTSVMINSETDNINSEPSKERTGIIIALAIVLRHFMLCRSVLIEVHFHLNEASSDQSSTGSGHSLQRSNSSLHPRSLSDHPEIMTLAEANSLIARCTLCSIVEARCCL